MALVVLLTCQLSFTNLSEGLIVVLLVKEHEVNCSLKRGLSMLHSNSGCGLKELNRVGACLHGTGPDPAIDLQFLEEISLILSAGPVWK